MVNSLLIAEVTAASGVPLYSYKYFFHLKIRIGNEDMNVTGEQGVHAPQDSSPWKQSASS